MMGVTIAKESFGIPENSILEITLAKYKVQGDLVYRQLDDEHSVAPFAYREWEIEYFCPVYKIVGKNGQLVGSRSFQSMVKHHSTHSLAKFWVCGLTHNNPMRSLSDRALMCPY
jgi:hypothetical protein